MTSETVQEPGIGWQAPSLMHFPPYLSLGYACPLDVSPMLMWLPQVGVLRRDRGPGRYSCTDHHHVWVLGEDGQWTRGEE